MPRRYPSSNVTHLLNFKQFHTASRLTQQQRIGHSWRWIISAGRDVEIEVREIVIIGAWGGARYLIYDYSGFCNMVLFKLAQEVLLHLDTVVSFEIVRMLL